MLIQTHIILAVQSTIISHDVKIVHQQQTPFNGNLHAHMPKTPNMFERHKEILHSPITVPFISDTTHSADTHTQTTTRIESILIQPKGKALNKCPLQHATAKTAHPQRGAASLRALMAKGESARPAPCVLALPSLL